MHKRHIDWVFFGIVATLVTFGMFFFVSAAFGIMTREKLAFTNVLFNQIFFGIILGSLGLYVASRLDYRLWRKNALWLLLAGIGLTILVFIPGIGFEHGGAKRWLDLGPFSFQPSEVLKFAMVVYAAAWFAAVKEKINNMKFGFIPLCVLLAIAATLLILQPDTGTFLITAAGLVAVYLAAGGRWWHAGVLLIAGVCFIAVLAFTKPYVMDRLTTFMNPDDAHGSAYQIRQALIAVGSGGLTGRGYGQSVQKFSFLPEPTGDSIFAVVAEEMGFLGAATVVLLYLAFAARGLFLAARAPDRFSGLVVVGVVILITSQSLLNIGSMLAVAPLTGVPLVFISQGGTALLVALFEIGIILNISKHRYL